MESCTTDTCSKAETTGESANLAKYMIQNSEFNTDDVKEFMAKNHGVDIDETDEKGRTPLMIACLANEIFTVRYLLDLGADINKECKNLNTPLHYACMHEKYVLEALFHFELFEDEGGVAGKKRVVELLMEHGAQMKPNSVGWTPPRYAALFGAEDIVKYFLWSDPKNIFMEDCERITILEILGVFQCLFTFDSIDPYHSFSKAIILRLETGSVIGTDEITALEECNHIRECRDLEELESVKDNSRRIRDHAYVVGERVLPDVLKRELFWPALFNAHTYAGDLEIGSETLTRYLYWSSYALKLEGECRMSLGTVLWNVARLLYSENEYLEDVDVDICDLNSYFNSYRNMLENITIPVDGAGTGYLKDALGLILAIIIHHWPSYGIGDCKKLLGDVSSVLEIYTSKCVDNDSTLLTFLFYMKEFIRDYNKSADTMKTTLRMINMACSTLLQYEDAASKDDDGNTMLHLVIGLMNMKETIALIYALTKVLVRHGCPVGLKNNEGKTSADLASTKRSIFVDDQSTQVFSDVLSCLSDSATVLPLEELAARVVLRKRIPYSDKLPSSLCNFVQTGSYDSPEDDLDEEDE